MASAKITEQLSVPCLHRCGSVDLLPDGSGAHLGGWDGVWIIDLPSGEERRRLRRDTGVVLWNARVSADGKRAVAAFGDCTLHVRDIASGEETFATPTKGIIVPRISRSRDGSLAAYGGTDGILRAHDFTKDTPAWSSPGNGWSEDVDACADYS